MIQFKVDSCYLIWTRDSLRQLTCASLPAPAYQALDACKYTLSSVYQRCACSAQVAIAGSLHSEMIQGANAGALSRQFHLLNRLLHHLLGTRRSVPGAIALLCPVPEFHLSCVGSPPDRT